MSAGYSDVMCFQSVLAAWGHGHPMHMQSI